MAFLVGTLIVGLVICTATVEQLREYNMLLLLKWLPGGVQVKSL